MFCGFNLDYIDKSVEPVGIITSEIITSIRVLDKLKIKATNADEQLLFSAFLCLTLTRSYDKLSIFDIIKNDFHIDFDDETYQDNSLLKQNIEGLFREPLLGGCSILSPFVRMELGVLSDLRTQRVKIDVIEGKTFYPKTRFKYSGEKLDDKEVIKDIIKVGTGGRVFTSYPRGNIANLNDKEQYEYFKTLGLRVLKEKLLGPFKTEKEEWEKLFIKESEKWEYEFNNDGDIFEQIKRKFLATTTSIYHQVSEEETNEDRENQIKILEEEESEEKKRINRRIQIKNVMSSLASTIDYFTERAEREEREEKNQEKKEYSESFGPDSPYTQSAIEDRDRRTWIGDLDPDKGGRESRIHKKDKQPRSLLKLKRERMEELGFVREDVENKHTKDIMRRLDTTNEMKEGEEKKYALQDLENEIEQKMTMGKWTQDADGIIKVITWVKEPINESTEEKGGGERKRVSSPTRMGSEIQYYDKIWHEEIKFLIMDLLVYYPESIELSIGIILFLTNICKLADIKKIHQEMDLEFHEGMFFTAFGYINGGNLPFVYNPNRYSFVSPRIKLPDPSTKEVLRVIPQWCSIYDIGEPDYSSKLDEYYCVMPATIRLQCRLSDPTLMDETGTMELTVSDLLNSRGVLKKSKQRKGSEKNEKKYKLWKEGTFSCVSGEAVPLGKQRHCRICGGVYNKQTEGFIEPEDLRVYFEDKIEQRKNEFFEIDIDISLDLLQKIIAGIKEKSGESELKICKLCMNHIESDIIDDMIFIDLEAREEVDDDDSADDEPLPITGGVDISIRPEVDETTTTFTESKE